MVNAFTFSDVRRYGYTFCLVYECCENRMIIRVFYGLRMGWRHRHNLIPYRHDPDLQAETILHINPKALKEEGIKVLAVDFDGVLAAHGEEKLENNIVKWLVSCYEVFGKGHVFILSNKPTRSRAATFASYGIEVIRAPRKKPYPDGLLYILSRTKVSPEELLLIDDRLLTGILAANIVGVQARWVTKPFINLAKRPLTELFFVVLRSFERQLLRSQKKERRRLKQQSKPGPKKKE